MKNVKYFKYKDTYNFNLFLKEHNYVIDDVKGFHLSVKRQCRSVMLKVYSFHFKNGGFGCFSVVTFKDYNHLLKTSLGLNGSNTLYWYQKADIKEYQITKYK